jgi:hypothetical protein
MHLLNPIPLAPLILKLSIHIDFAKLVRIVYSREIYISYVVKRHQNIL